MSSLDSQIRQLMREIVDVAPETLDKSFTGGQSRSPRRQSKGLRSTYALALAAAVALFVGAASLFPVLRDNGVAASNEEATPGLGLTYRYQVKTTVVASETHTENPQLQAELDAQAEPGRGPDAEGAVDLSSGRAELQLELTHDSLLDRIIEPTEPLVVRSNGDKMITNLNSEDFEELNPFVDGGFESQKTFGPTFPESTKSLDRLNVLLENPEWVEVSTEGIDGVSTTHFRADLSVSTGEERFTSDSLLGFVTIDGAWEGRADVWLGADDLVRRVIIVINHNEGEDALRLDYFDYDSPVDIEWPQF